MSANSSRRRFLGNLATFAAALPLIGNVRGGAQQRLPRIGFMSGAAPSLISSFEDEMRKLGYVTGRNIQIEMRIAGANRREPPITNVNQRETVTRSLGPHCTGRA